MGLEESRDTVYRFGEFVLDSRLHALLRRGERVALTPKATNVLLVLVERAGHVVTREELIAAVWPDCYVGESNLTQTVFMLRKALGRDSGEPYIATVQGRGYRFVAAVRRVSDDSPGSVVRGAESESPVAVWPPAARRTSQRHYLCSGIGAVAAVSLRVTTQLIRVEERPHVGSREYHGEPGSLLALERNIAQDIAEEIQLSLDEMTAGDP